MSIAANGRPQAHPSASPFALENEPAYRRWRASKLAAYPQHAGDLKVPVADLARPTVAERARVIEMCRRANMAIYACPRGGPSSGEEDGIRQALGVFLAAFGLRDVEAHRSAESDGLVAIEVDQRPAKRGFIPYTTRPLSWHTDGYYNAPATTIRAMVLHCVRAASSGGENALLDPEIAYIRLRDANPRWLAALMRPEAMTIPEAQEEDGRVRLTSTGPVFSIDAASGSLAMRYTARGRNIAWRDDADTRAAIGFLARLLKEEQEPLILKVRLAPGEGLICNNVLHTRGAFEEGGGPGRLIYRARYAQRIAGTGLNEAGHA